jgi:hypothetical protein
MFRMNIKRSSEFKSEDLAGHLIGIVRSFNFILKLGVEDSIVNTLYGLRITDHFEDKFK